MKLPTRQVRRFIVFLGYFALAFALYAVADSQSGVLIAILLVALAALMALGIATG